MNRSGPRHTTTLTRNLSCKSSAVLSCQLKGIVSRPWIISMCVIIREVNRRLAGRVHENIQWFITPGFCYCLYHFFVLDIDLKNSRGNLIQLPRYQPCLYIAQVPYSRTHWAELAFVLGERTNGAIYLVSTTFKLLPQLKANTLLRPYD